MIKPAELDSEGSRSIWSAITAAASGNLPELRRLIQRDPALARCEYWYTPLIHFAVREGHIDAVRFLLEAGADPEWNGYYGGGLSLMARDRGHEEIGMLLDEARDRQTGTAPAVKAEDHPIHTAAEARDLRRVRALLDADPSLIRRSDRAGGLPLHRAVMGSARSVIELLLDRGADIHALHGASLPSVAMHLEAIDLALWGGPRTVRPSWRRAMAGRFRSLWTRRRNPGRRPRDLETARLLLRRGASCDLAIASALGDIERVREILDEAPDRIQEARPNGRRALTAAVEFGCADIVRLLLERGADPGWSEPGAPKGASLHAAARSGDRVLIETLLAHGADPNGEVDSAGSVVFAARTPELRHLLVSHGGRIDPYDLVWLDEDDEVMRRVTEDPGSANRGCGGVWTAVCTRGKRELLERLLAVGLRVPPVVTGCQSYLLENLEMLRVLLASGMSPDLPNWQNQTLLHACTGMGAHGSKCAELLLDAGATISKRDDVYRSTPLAWAARNDNQMMVEFLLSRGAPAELPDDEPWATPLAWATRRGHRRIGEILRQAGT